MPERARSSRPLCLSRARARTRMARALCSPPPRPSRALRAYEQLYPLPWTAAGRLFQVEYAMEAIGKAGTCIGIMAEGGIVIAVEKKVVSKLLQPPKSSEKTYKLDDHLVCAVAGLTADANELIDIARLMAQRYAYTYQEPQPVEQLVSQICDRKHFFTQFGGASAGLLLLQLLLLRLLRRHSAAPQRASPHARHAGA